MNIDDKRKLQRLILRHMSEHELTQKEMAIELNIQQSTLSAWLSDDPQKGHGIRKNHIARILHVCGDVAGRDFISIAGNGNNINSHNHAAATPAAGDVEKFRAGLICALIDSDLPPEALQVALKVVKDFKG